MSKRNGMSLPGSLDLLLDTMCNTFGGIVFIAIALVIITQISGKKMVEEVSKPVDAKTIEEAQNRLSSLEKELKELREKELIEYLSSNGFSPENLPVLLAYLKASEENEKVLDALDAEEDKANKLKLEKLDFADKKAEIIVENNEKAAELKRKLAEIKTLNESQQRHLEKLKSEIEATKAKAKKTVPLQSVTFACEQDVGSRRQINVYLYKGSYYTEQNVNRSQYGNAIRITFDGYHGLNFAEITRALSKEASSYNFISVWADCNSFEQLLKIREWLRKKRYMSSWSYVDEFTFYKDDSLKASY